VLSIFVTVTKEDNDFDSTVSITNDGIKQFPCGNDHMCTIDYFGGKCEQDLLFVLLN
jgi:hypothetical protein